MDTLLCEDSKSKYRKVDSTLSFKDFQLFLVENCHKIVAIFFLNSYLNRCDEATNKFRRYYNEIV